MQGRFTAGVFPTVLRALHGERRTGILRLTYADTRSALVFERGRLVRGESSVPLLHMGEVMVAHGHLTPGLLEQATRTVIAEHVRLGQALERLGILSRVQVEDGMALHVREILTDAICWKDGAFAFTDGEPEERAGDDYPLRLSTGQLLLQVTAAIPSREAILHALGDLSRVLLPASDPFLRFQRLTLTPVDGFVLSRVDGTCSAKDVVRLTPVAPEAVERSLLGLVCVGLAEFVREQMEAPPPSRDTAQFLRQEILDAHAGIGTRAPHEILGVPALATLAEVKAAYFRLARRFHPDAQHDPALFDLGAKLEDIFFRLGAAYEALAASARHPQVADSPQAAAPTPASLDVEGLFRRGEERFNEGRYWEAIALLGEAVPAATGRLRPRARVLLARAYLKYPEHVKSAERELLAALQENPDSPEACYHLGTLYARGGLSARATAMFRRTLELNPRHRAAMAELEQAGDAPSPGKLRKFFGRP